MIFVDSRRLGSTGCAVFWFGISLSFERISSFLVVSFPGVAVGAVGMMTGRAWEMNELETGVWIETGGSVVVIKYWVSFVFGLGRST